MNNSRNSNPESCKLNRVNTDGQDGDSTGMYLQDPHPPEPFKERSKCAGPYIPENNFMDEMILPSFYG